MGNDGGSIPKRRELVKEAARNKTTAELKESRQEQQSHQWTTCPLSRRPLAEPVVSDSGGHLYNKDAILEFLLPAAENRLGVSKTDQEEILKGRVKSLKDVVEVKFEVDDDENKSGTKKHNGDSEKRTQRWICPMTRKELGASVKAVYLVPCGHAFSESAVKEVSGEECLQCNEKYEPENVIPILPISSAEIERLDNRAGSLKERGLSHSLKKVAGSGKKRKKAAEASAAARPSIDALEVEPSTAQAQGQPDPSRPSSTTTPTETKPSTPKPETSQRGGNIKHAATASLTARVMEDERERKRRRHVGMNENLKDLFSQDPASLGTAEHKTMRNGDFMTRGFSIPAGAKR